jgi:5-methyltetrahydropteroyltriglutamate--homocysteine methyltransferase
VAEQVDRDIDAFVKAQMQAGLSLVSDGMLDWQDLFRPLAERSEGLDARPLTRFLDTNTFYRALIVGGEPRLGDPIPSPELPRGGWLGTLPSPTAFAHAAGGEASAKALAAGVIAPQIAAYARDGCALVVLSDPFLSRVGSARELVEALRELPTAVPIALQLPFGDAGPVLEDLAEAPLAALGVDFYATSLDEIPREYPQEIMAGVVDSRSSALEDAAQIQGFVETLAERRPAGISLTVNGDLQFVPEPIARRKIAVLGEARMALAQAA